MQLILELAGLQLRRQVWGLTVVLESPTVGPRSIMAPLFGWLTGTGPGRAGVHNDWQRRGQRHQAEPCIHQAIVAT